jgi:cytochrome c oxidase subunit 4
MGATAGNRLFVWVWVYLLVLTAVEVVLAYIHLFSTPTMLIILMILSIVKAGLIVAYFMHLRFERTTLVLSIVPPLVLTIALLFVFFPDGMRLLELRR